MERHIPTPKIRAERIPSVYVKIVAGSFALASFHFGLTPVEVKEMVYQATAYLGIGRVFPFLKATNKIFTELGIALPVQGQATTTTENRLENGIEAQVAIFGEHMKDFYQSGDLESNQIHYWLTDNCFGDYYM